jgi:hypothetical protein
MTANAATRRAGFSVQKLVRRTELPITAKLSSGDETPPIANVLLCTGVLFLIVKIYLDLLRSLLTIRGLNFHMLVCEWECCD